MKNYVKVALKVLTRRKFFTFISLFGISLTLVVLVVAAALLDDIFSPKGPEKRFNRALVVYRVQEYGEGATISMGPGYGFLDKYVLHLPDIERATAFTNALQRTVYRDRSRIETTLRRTDANYWKVLDFEFLEGRPFTAEEEARGAFVAVISKSLRGKLFDGKPAAGQSMEIDGQRFAIIGVVPDASVLRTAAFGDIWTPITTAKSTDYRSEMVGSFNAVVLLHDKADRRRVQKAFAAMVPRIPVTDPKVFDGWRVGLDTKYEAFARDLMGPMPRRFRDSAPAVLRTVLLTMAVLFMTLPALNLVTLNLSRILERGSEIGVRKAFGAPRRALVSQFVLENVILSLIGGVIAYALAGLALALINRTELIPYTQLTPNLRVFGYGMLVAVFFGVFSGAYPAWRMSRLDPVTALRGGVA